MTFNQMRADQHVMGTEPGDPTEKRKEVNGDPGMMQCAEAEGDHPDWSSVAKAMLKAVITKIPVATVPSFLINPPPDPLHLT